LDPSQNIPNPTSWARQTGRVKFTKEKKKDRAGEIFLDQRILYEYIGTVWGA
jgi:hypothetical protein